MIAKITCTDGHILSAYIAEPQVKAKGAILVLHEIYGMTTFIKAICDAWAREGYVAIAPALYDRLEPNVVIDYEGRNYENALDMRARLMHVQNSDGLSSWDLQLFDIESTMTYVSLKYHVRLGLLGFSWGGSLAWLAACRFDGISCVSSYYGTHTYEFIDETPKCPLMLHAGVRDELLTADKVHYIRERHPDVLIYSYDSAHAFCCPMHSNYVEEECLLADRRTKELFWHYLNQVDTAAG